MAKDTQKWKPTWLRAWREWKGLNLAQLAADMDYNEGTLSLIENGKARYNQDVLEGAAKVIGVPTGYILNRRPPPKGVDIDRADPDFIAWQLAEMPDQKRRQIGRMIKALEDEGEPVSS